MRRVTSEHPFVFQVREEGKGNRLKQAADDLLSVIGDQAIQFACGAGGAPYVLGVIEACSQKEAGRMIDQLCRLSVAHPGVTVSLAGYGTDLPPTVLSDGRFTLFRDAYQSFCSLENQSDLG